MWEREIYPNAPIVLMAIEVRHSPCDQLERKQVKQVAERVKDLLPLPGSTTEVEVIIQTGPNSRPIQQQVASAFPKWMSRDKRSALTVRTDSMVIETTNYGSYEKVRRLLQTALNARVAVAPPAGVERIGLRYIDEIRVPAESEGMSPDWSEWVVPTLLGPSHVGNEHDLVLAVSEGLVVFSSQGNRALVLRYGAQSDYVVQSTPELRRPLPPPGPFFKLDIDSFWQAGDEVPEFDPNSILGQADMLHEPVRGVFESVITDRLREEVLRRG